MPNNPYKYPLHPGQTHAEPLYAQIPLEEYESIKRENKLLKEENARMRAYRKKQKEQREKENAERTRT